MHCCNVQVSMPLRVGEPLAVDCHGSAVTSLHSTQHSDVIADSHSSIVDLRRWLVPLDCAADGQLQLTPGYVPAEKLTTLAVEIRNVVTGQCAISVSAPSNTLQQTAATATTAAAAGAADSTAHDSMDVDEQQHATDTIDATAGSSDDTASDAVNASVQAIHEYLLKVQHSAACEDVFAAVRSEVLSTATASKINTSSSSSSNSSSKHSRVWLDTGHGVTDAASAMTAAVAVAASNSSDSDINSNSIDSSSHSRSRRVCGLGADTTGLCIAHALDDDVTVFVDATDADHVMSIKLIRHSDIVSSSSSSTASTTTVAAAAAAAAVHSSDTGNTVTTTAGDSSMQLLCELALLHLNCLVQERRRKQSQAAQTQATAAVAAAAVVKSELIATQINGNSSKAAIAPKAAVSAVPQQQAAVLSATVKVVQHHMFREKVR
jgi:hypothetical protein